MKLNKLFTKTALFLVLLLTFTTQAWAQHTYIVVDADGNELISATSNSNGTPVAPAEINSPWCTLTYWDAATGGHTITSLPSTSTTVYVRYTVKDEYASYFNGTKRFKFWLHGSYRYAQPSNYKIWNSRTANSAKGYDYFYFEGDPYRMKIYNVEKGSSAGPLSYVSGDAQVQFSTSTAATTYNEFVVVSCKNNYVALRFRNTPNETYITNGNPLWAWGTTDRGSDGNRVTFEEVAEQVSVTYHLVNADNKSLEGRTVTVSQDTGSSPSLPTVDSPLNCAINTGAYYTNAACTTTNTGTISESNKEFWVTYTFDATTLKTNTNIEFSEDYANAKWMTLQFGNRNTYYLYYDESNNDVRKRVVAAPDNDTYDFAFIGDPFKFRIVNKAAGSLKDVQDGGGTGTRSLTLVAGTDNSDWTLVAPNTSGFMIVRNYDGTPFYWNANSTNAPIIQYSTKKDNDNDLLATREASAPTVTFTQSSYTTDKNTNVTITANATLNGGNLITYTAIERKNADGTWTEVARSTSETPATVSYIVVASEYGNSTYRAVAEPDGHSELIGTSGEVTVTVQYPTVSGGPFTLKLVDKSGNVLFTKENVTGTDVQNSFGDPLPAEWRSPMVTQYKYYTDQGQTNAKNADDTNLLDWTVNPTSTVYVGYDVSNALDLNSSSFSDFNSLMNTRVPRNGDAKMQVRNADSFGKMYMLKFKTSADYYAENTKDGVSTTVTPSGSYVYPYTNGDGPIYVYPDKT